jgi:hypothetical protein
MRAKNVEEQRAKIKGKILKMSRYGAESQKGLPRIRA